jgi:hypothetical protein
MDTGDIRTSTFAAQIWVINGSLWIAHCARSVYGASLGHVAVREYTRSDGSDPFKAAR